MPYEATTYSDTSGSTVLTQDLVLYSGLQQEYQSNSGAVVTTGPTPTPSVQYGFTGPAAGQNYSRPTSMTYLNGRQIDYQYNSALDGAISQVDAVADDSASTLPLATYTYLGLSTIVQQLDGNNIGLSYIQQSGDSSAITSGSAYAGDRYTGLDRFSRVADQNWVLNPTSASTPTPTPTPAPLSTDRSQMGYDAGSNVLYSDNLVNPSESELYHSSSTAAGDNNNAYDPLARESAFLRGTLSASGNNTYSSAPLDTISNANISTAAGSDQTYTLDALGNWTSSGTAAGTGTSTAPTLTSTSRTNNSQNEVTGVGSNTLVFDHNGNTTTDQNGDKISYDAWNHVVTNINPATNHEVTYTTDALGDRVAEQDGAGATSGPILIVNNGSIQRSMVDSLTVIFPSAVTLSSGAITLYNVTASASESMSYSNPSGDGKTWLVAFTGSDIVGGSLPNAVYNCTVHHADVTGITLGSDVVYAFHRLFGDINGDATVNATDHAAFNEALVQYDPAFDYNADGFVNGSDSLRFAHDLGTTLSYTASGTFMIGPSTTAPFSSTDISSWSAGTNDMYYSGANVIEERQSGSSGAWRQEVWGLGYVNSLIEQDTATAVDSGGVLPTSHFLQYALDTGFNGTGVNVTSASGSYDSVAIQGNGQIVVAGVTGANLTITRYNPNAALDPGFGTAGVVTIAETSPSFCKLAIDSSGNIDVAVNSGSTVKLYQLSGTDGSTNWSTALTFATSAVPQGLAIDSTGKIVVAGDSSSGAGIYVARVTSSGSVDTTFGSSGYVNAPLSGAPSGLSLAFDSSGNILIAGSDGGDFSVVRLTSSGSVDTTFGTSGEAKVNMGGTDTAYAVSPGPAGTIVAAGVSVQGGSNYAALIRLTSSGSLDTTFNSTGKILGSSGSGTIRAILVQTNGEILAGGDASSGTAQKVWMFTPAGAADTEFASGGTLTANSGATVYGWAVASGATQRIVVAGSYGGDEALAAFAPASLRLYSQQDSNYNVTAMVDSNGNVVQRYLLDSYGNMSVLSAAWTPQSDLFNTQVGFQGMWLDAASGLYHTPNRDYSASLGTWMEQDRGYWDGSNLYRALDDSPVDHLDPGGLDPASKPTLGVTGTPAAGVGGTINDGAGHAGTVTVLNPADYTDINGAAHKGIAFIYKGTKCETAHFVQFASVTITGTWLGGTPVDLPLDENIRTTAGTHPTSQIPGTPLWYVDGDKQLGEPTYPGIDGRPAGSYYIFDSPGPFLTGADLASLTGPISPYRSLQLTMLVNTFLILAGKVAWGVEWLYIEDWTQKAGLSRNIVVPKNQQPLTSLNSGQIAAIKADYPGQTTIQGL